MCFEVDDNDLVETPGLRAIQGGFSDVCKGTWIIPQNVVAENNPSLAAYTPGTKINVAIKKLRFPSSNHTGQQVFTDEMRDERLLKVMIPLSLNVSKSLT